MSTWVRENLILFSKCPSWNKRASCMAHWCLCFCKEDFTVNLFYRKLILDLFPWQSSDATDSRFLASATGHPAVWLSLRLHLPEPHSHPPIRLPLSANQFETSLHSVARSHSCSWVIPSQSLDLSYLISLLNDLSISALLSKLLTIPILGS